MKTAYRRILLKLSGEYLGGESGRGFDTETVLSLANQVKLVRGLGIETAIVLGGGNFFRGAKAFGIPMDRVTGDHIGMLATMMNSLCLKEALSSIGVATEVMNGLRAPQVAEDFCKKQALDKLGEGKVLIFGGGTGNPFFSTDSAAVLRALEIGADIVIKGTKVDGVYDKDPMRYQDAVKYDDLSFTLALEKDLKVMDGAAIALCRDNELPLCVLDITNQKDLLQFLKGEKTGTMVR